MKSLRLFNLNSRLVTFKKAAGGWKKEVLTVKRTTGA